MKRVTEEVEDESKLIGKLGSARAGDGGGSPWVDGDASIRD